MRTNIAKNNQTWFSIMSNLQTYDRFKLIDKYLEMAWART